LPISDFLRGTLRAHLLKSTIENRKSKISGGKGIRTPDFQLAKLALYQLSYAPCEFSILDCGSRIANLGSGMRDLPICDPGTIRSPGEADAGWRSDDRHPGFVRFSGEAAFRALWKAACFPSLFSTNRYR
jgi:hypothetical protein